jgi:glycosyltransferase involved in cell wall biosynthesis
VFFTANDAGDLQLETAGWWQKQKRLYDLFRKACEKHHPDHVLILELTHLELPLILFGSPVPLSAILFVQYPELSGFRKNKGMQAQPVSNGWKKVSKHWKTRLLLSRAPVRNLFLLNGANSCDFLNRHFGRRARFIPVSDPAPETEPQPDFSFEVSNDRRICLFFGAISRRKGADVFLNTLEKIRPETAQTNSFFVCGKPEPDYGEAFEQSVRNLRTVRPDIDLRIDSRFISDEEMMAMFEQADLVLMPCTRSEYSSGILALAAKAGTPLLGPPDGLLGRLIRENGLGLAAKMTPAALEADVSLNEELRRKFVARNTIENFTKPILDAVCHES